MIGKTGGSRPRENASATLALSDGRDALRRYAKADRPGPDLGAVLWRRDALEGAMAERGDARANLDLERLYGRACEGRLIGHTTAPLCLRLATEADDTGPDHPPRGPSDTTRDIPHPIPFAPGEAGRARDGAPEARVFRRSGGASSRGDTSAPTGATGSPPRSRA